MVRSKQRCLPGLRHLAFGIFWGTLLSSVLAVYPVLAGEMLERADITGEMANKLVRLAQESMLARLEGRPAKMSAAGVYRQARNGVHVILLRDGKIVGEGTARQATLMGNVRVAGARAVGGLSREDISRAVLLLTVLLPEKPVPQAIPIMVGRLRVLGLAGFRVEYQGMEAFVPPLTPLLKDNNWKATLIGLARQVSPAPEGTTPLPAAPDYKAKLTQEHSRLLKVSTEEHFRLWLVPGVNIVLFPGDENVTILYRKGKLVRITDVTAATVRAAIKRVENWYQANQHADGRFPYYYDPVTDRESRRHNLVRRAMNIAAIGYLWRFSGENATREMGLKALRRLLDDTYLEDPQRDFGYLRQPEAERAPLGAAAGALMAIINLEAHRDYPEMKARAKRLVALMKAVRHADGRYDTYYPADVGKLNVDYFPGEVQLALMEWARAVNDTALVDICFKSYRYYKEYFWEAQQREKFARYPFIPWHTQACTRLYAAQRRQELADFVFRMNELLLATQQIYPERGKELPSDCRGRFFNLRKRQSGHPHVSSTGVYLEGLVEAFALARELGEEKLVESFRRAILWGVRDLLQLQVKDRFDTLGMPNPKRALGGFRSRADSSRIRIDSVQHAVVALIKVARTFTPEDYAAARTLAGD